MMRNYRLSLVEKQEDGKWTAAVEDVFGLILDEEDIQTDRALTLEVEKRIKKITKQLAEDRKRREQES